MVESEKRAWPYLLGGLAVGAACGILFAPQEGKETRKQLGNWLQDRREYGKTMFAKISEKFPMKKQQVLAAWKAGKETYQQERHEEQEHRRHSVHA